MKKKSQKEEKAESKGGYELYTFDPVIYPIKVCIAIGTTAEELKERFGDVGEDDETTIASVIQVKDQYDGKGVVLLRFRNRYDMDYDTVAHESIHAAFEILEYIDFKPDYEGQEPLTYLAGWVARCVGNIVKGLVQPDREEPKKKEVRG